MNPKDRLLTTLDHREPDKVPVSGNFSLDTRLKLRGYYGVETDEELNKKLGIEVDRVVIEVGAPRDWKPTAEYTDFSQAMGYHSIDQMTHEYASYEDWGIKRKLGAKLQDSAVQHFLYTHHPWKRFTEPGQIDEVELPDLDMPGRFDRAIKLVEDYGETRLVFAGLGHCQWTKAWELRGLPDFMKDLHTNLKMAEAILDRLNDYYLDLADRLLDIGGEGLMFSEDWGNNKSLFINPNMWRKIFKPRYKKLFDRAKRRDGFVYFHSDGNITPIVGDLVEIGADILNPVQPECMDQLEVKRKYGDKVTIATGVSVQKTLPYGKVEDVRREVLLALENLAPGGGFMYGTSHRVLKDVSVENLVALYETCKKFGNYPITIS